jgi:hypothetical protein
VTIGTCSYKLVRLLENVDTCRRVLFGRHFGDDYDVADCKRTCDTCLAAASKQVERVDVTGNVQILVEIVSAFVASSNSSLASRIVFAFYLI